MGGTEKPLFLLRALPQKNSDFAVLVADEFNLEPVEWRHPGARATYAVPRPYPSAQEPWRRPGVRALGQHRLYPPHNIRTTHGTRLACNFLPTVQHHHGGNAADLILLPYGGFHLGVYFH